MRRRGFFASCPLLQGCHAEGDTFGEAVDNLENVIEAHLEIRQKKGEIVPFVEMNSYQNINFQIPIPVLA